MTDPVSGLRKSLDEQAKQLSEEAVRNNGQVTAEQLEALTRLQRLIGIVEEMRPAPPRNKWVLPGLLVSSLAVASVLLFVHLPAAEVEVDATVSEVAFRLDTDTPLTPGMVLAFLGVSGPQKLELPLMPLPGDQPAEIPKETNRISFRVLDKEKNGNSSVTMPSLELPAGTEVRLEARSPNNYRLTLNTPKGSRAEISLSCEGNIQVGMAGQPAQQYRFPVPAAFSSQAASEQIILDMTFPDQTKAALTPQLPVSNLAFVHVEQNSKQTMVRYVSTILTGVMYLDSLNGEQRNLRSGEGLRFQSSHGELRSVVLRDGLISVQFQGGVERMTSGSNNTLVNLMPSLLEWLRARHGLYLLWGTGLYLFGILGGVLRWLRALQ